MKIKNNYNFIVAGLAIGFFFIYGFLTLTFWLPEYSQIQHFVFNWPDSSANYFFSKVMAETGSFIWPHITNLYTDNLIHARSINVLDTTLVPMTFLPSLALWGAVYKLVNQYVMLLTPALASVTVYLFYRLVTRIFQSRPLGFLSALLILPMSPWLYFANFSMLPVVLFIFFIVAGSLCLTISWQQSVKSFSWWTLGWLLIGFGIIVRPTEMLWVLISALVIIFWKRASLTKSKYFSAAFSLAVMAATLAFLNYGVYGHWLSFGYQNLQNGGWPTEFQGQENSLKTLLRSIVAPFGLQWKAMLANSYKYIFKLQSVSVLLAFGSAVLILLSRKTRESRYVLISAFVSVLLVIYYGSWQMTDQIVQSLNTISISYVRYFMPIYFLAVPLVAYFIYRLFWGQSRYSKAAVYLLVAIIGISNLGQAFVTKNDGLIATRETLQSYHRDFVEVQKIAPKGSFVYSERADKVFFPYYHVIVPQGDLPLWPRISRIPNIAKVYYWTDKDTAALEQEVAEMATSGLQLKHVVDIGQHHLYQIIQN